MYIIIPNNLCIAYTVTNATNMLQVVDFSRLFENQTCCNLIFADLLQLASSLLIKSLKYQLASSLLTTCSRLIIIKPKQAMRTHPDVGLMTEACSRLAATYAFLAVYSNIIIINVGECCVNYVRMLMQWTSITAINILTMFVYCIISDHTMVKLYRVLPTTYTHVRIVRTYFYV